MDDEVDRINAAIDDLRTEVTRKRQANYVLCNCTLRHCHKPDVETWERKNYVNRAVANRHMREQRAHNRQPKAKKGSNSDHHLPVILEA